MKRHRPCIWMLFCEHSSLNAMTHKAAQRRKQVLPELPSEILFTVLRHNHQFLDIFAVVGSAPG
jgi:hypothetical protein